MFTSFKQTKPLHNQTIAKMPSSSNLKLFAQCFTRINSCLLQFKIDKRVEECQYILQYNDHIYVFSVVRSSVECFPQIEQTTK